MKYQNLIRWRAAMRLSIVYLVILNQSLAQNIEVNLKEVSKQFPIKRASRNNNNNNNTVNKSESHQTEESIPETKAQETGPIDETIITSDFHRKNVGKILFSKTPITIGKENPDQFTSSFSAGDKIYAVVYLPQSISKLAEANSNANCRYTYLVENNQDNDSESGYIEFTHNDEDLKNGFYLIEIIPDPSNAYHGLDPVEWADALGKLTKKKHTIEIGFSSGYHDAFATGVLHLDWSGANVEQLKNNAQKASAMARDNYARHVEKLPDWFAQESNYVFRDPQLSAANMKAMLKKEWAKNGVVEITKIIAAASTFSEDWTVDKNEYGIPKCQTTWGNIGAIYKASDGWCYYVTKIHFTRDYNGAGSYGNAKFLTDGGHVKIDCSKTK